MKIDRHSRIACPHRVKPIPASRTRGLSIALGLALVAAVAAITLWESSAFAQDVSQAAPSPTDPKKSVAVSNPQADAVLLKTLTLLVHGPAFDAKVRETVWTTGRKVVGVGTYEQAGGGSGAYNLQVMMHDGDGKHQLQQISDGRLAWTRTEIAGKVSLRRVDVGRLEEWVRGTDHVGVSPRLIVGAWAEMLSTIRNDYVLSVHEGHLKEEPVWVVSGDLRPDRRQQVLTEAGRDAWPMLHPTRVMVALQRKQDPEIGFGQLLPIRIEYWSDPVVSHTASKTEKRLGRMIALIELYSIRPIASPRLERFRFSNREAEVNFIDETDRYIKRYGVQLTAGQRQLLRR